MNDQAFDLVVVGGGPGGYVAAMPQILPAEDEEISAILAKELKRKGIAIRTGTLLRAMQRQEDSVTVTIEAEGAREQRTVDRVLLAMGVVGNVENLGLEHTDVQVEKGAIKVGRFPFIANGKAIALGETEGLVKTIFDTDSGKLLGAHMIGSEVTEMIQGYGIALNLEATQEALMHTIFAHPTLSETMHESVLAAFDRSLHL